MERQEAAGNVIEQRGNGVGGARRGPVECLIRQLFDETSNALGSRMEVDGRVLSRTDCLASLSICVTTNDVGRRLS